MEKIKINSYCTSIRQDVEPKDILLFSSRKVNWFNYFESKVKHSHNLQLMYPSAWHMPRRNSCIRRHVHSSFVHNIKTYKQPKSPSTRTFKTQWQYNQ